MFRLSSEKVGQNLRIAFEEVLEDQDEDDSVALCQVLRANVAWIFDLLK